MSGKIREELEKLKKSIESHSKITSGLHKMLLGIEETTPERVFIDTNIFIYAIFDKNSQKREKVIKLLDKLQNKGKKEVIISTQVLGEIFNTLHRKFKVDKNKIIDKLEIIAENTIIKDITETTVRQSWEIAKKNNYSYYDCLIIASALENKCKILYSEDMQDGHSLDGQLKIITPCK